MQQIRMMNFMETARKGSNENLCGANKSITEKRNEKFSVAVKCNEKNGAVGKLGATKISVQEWVIQKEEG
jgi:hypothetical protein